MPFEYEIHGARTPIRLYRWDVGRLYRRDADSPGYQAVIVHGYGEHAGRYEHVAQALIRHGAVVWAADYPGHGRSVGERALIEDVNHLVADTERVVQYAGDVIPDLPLVLIGHSLGGIVATRFAQQHSDQLSALVLSGPAIGGNPDILGLVGLPEIPDIPIDPSWLSRDPEVGRSYAEDPLVWHGPFKRPTLEAFVAAVQQVASGGSLGSLPTLWIHGEHDPLVPLQQAREAIERVRGTHFEERIYPEAKHEIFNEINREEVIADVTAFLDRVLSAAPARAGGG
jgi:alpha-beta hydrolase superfamily lysophospholipase